MMKYFKILIISLFTLLQISASAQDKDTYPKMIINEYNDTLIIFTYIQSKRIISDLIKYDISDSLIVFYQERDSINIDLVSFQKQTIDNLNKKIDNLNKINYNNNKIIDNKDETIIIMEKEVKKQKRHKIFAIISGAVLALTILLLK